MSRSALLIGINRYRPEGGIPALKYAEQDAALLAEALRAHCGFECQTLLGEQATREAIRAAVKSAGTGSLFLFFFAGHGESVEGAYYLHPWDGEAESGFDSIPFTELARHWAGARFGYERCVALLDACRSSLGGGGRRGPVGLQSEDTRDAVAAQERSDRDLRILYGCAYGQCCLEFDELSHGLLSYHLAEVIRERGEAGLTLNDLVEEASDRMRAWQKEKRGQVAQSPQWLGTPTKARIVLVEGQADTAAQPTKAKVVCPACGIRNDPDETFRCLVCGRDYLCLAHHDRAWRRCEDCVAEEKRKAEEQEAARRADEQRKAKEAAARAEAERRRAAEAAKEEAKRKQEEKRRLTAAPEWAKVSEQQKQAAVAVGFPVARELDLGGVALRMVLIPSGEFMMGSPNNEAQRDNNDEGPVHRVHIARPFYMGIHEVTQEQWQAVMGSNPAGFKGPKNPVENVSWDDCQEFCKKVSQKTGLTLRLPTEAEWEYACRAGTTTPFYFGETISTEQANYDGNYTYGNGRKGEDRQRTTPVGSFAPNAFGLYDMHGNVLEWCQDWYGEDYYGKSPAEDPQGPESGQYRVRRGGAWLNGPGYTRSANRSWSTPGNWNSYFGFRAVVSVAR